MQHIRITSAWLSILLLASPISAQEAKTYTDGQGRKVHFPLGEISFADALVSFEMGNPAPKNTAARRTEEILGEPNDSSLSLGCSGTVVVRFDDNSLVNIDGPDLYVFEIGPMVEATNLAISTNGTDWVDIGPITGSTAAIDIEPVVPERSAPFQYVRLIDRNIDCRAGNYSGADIDAVGAIGAAVRITLNGNVLFDFDSAELREEAVAELDRVAATIETYVGATVIVEGHTDAKGADSYNQGLSQQRAAAVQNYLLTADAMAPEQAVIRGYGESRPVATYETDEGRQANRRVDLIIIPRAAAPAQ